MENENQIREDYEYTDEEFLDDDIFEEAIEVDVAPPPEQEQKAEEANEVVDKPNTSLSEKGKETSKGFRQSLRDYLLKIKYTYLRLTNQKKCPYCFENIINDTFKPTEDEKDPRKIAICSNPDCARELPIGFFKTNSKVISLVGGENSGKSTFITVLTELLLNEDKVLQANGMYAELIDNGTRIMFHNKMQRLEGERILDGTTTGEKIEPWVISIDYKNKNKTIYISLFDIPGEVFRDADTLINGYKEYGNISNADGLIFLIDPQNIKNFVEKYNQSSSTGNGYIMPSREHFKTDQNIVHTIYKVFASTNKVTPPKKIKIPVAFGISKVDLLDKIEPIFIPEGTDNELLRLEDVLSDSEFASSELYDFLKDEAGELTPSIHKKFAKHAYFPVAPIGKIPNGSTIVGGIQPIGVLHPLYWLLRQLKFL